MEHPFGPAYRVMYEQDVHAPGSIDRRLMAEMVGLCADSAGWLYAAPASRCSAARPELARLAAEATAGADDDEARVDAIARFCRALCDRAPSELDEMRFGGTEEEIVRRGSAWCSDLARVAAALAQALGLPARVVYLADTAQAYSGHAIAEVYRRGRWGALDPVTAVVYRHPDGAPASTWELMRDPALVLAHQRPDGSAPTSDPGLFRAAAIAGYDHAATPPAAYVVSGLNAYYRAILEQADRGWPGGLRWLQDEDRIT